MDVEYDSSGTDDDLPPPHQNKMIRGHFSGSRRPVGISSFPYPRIHEESDMESKIHQLEQEAYFSVLRAFKAQADALSWDKEGLITELRKELRLSNEEHSKLLRRANEDETIRRIREWRKSSGLLQTGPGVHSAAQAVRDPVPSPSVSASRKKQKKTSPLPSKSFAGPSPFHRQTMVAANQPPSSSAKHGPMMGPKGKKHKSIPPGASSIHPGSAGRGQYGNRLSSGAQKNEPAQGAFNPLVGRKIRTRWPEDNNFYEALIIDYKPEEGRHALVYDMGTANETWEWVNLSEISPDDIQWDGEDPGISTYGGHGGPSHGINGPFGRDNTAGSGRGRGITKGQSRKNIPPSRNGLPKKGPNDIKLLNTNTVISEVERVFSASHPDPAEMEKAKRVVKEHELALMDAISRLGDLCGGESDEDGRFLHGQTMDRQ